MGTSKFSLEFELNVAEVRKLNKMYFKRLYKERVTIVSVIVLAFLIFFDFFNLNSDEDFIKWELRTIAFIVLFLMFHYPIVNAICRIIFQLSKKIADYSTVFGKYKFNFTNSFIYVHSPLGAFAHKWSQIEKAVLTKDFFFLYVKDDDQHIISISNKFNKGRNINELIAFVESNVIEITKM
jgi:hypothetical protein